MDAEDALTRSEPSGALLEAIEIRIPIITCEWLAKLGYPFQYRVNEAHLHHHGYFYDIRYDAWFRDGR